MKTALITGAGIGIGRATAKTFGNHGWRVIVTDVLEMEGAAVAAEIAEAGGIAEFHPLDVTSTEAAEAVMAQVHEAYGPLSALICNAGIAHKVPLEELTDEKWDHTFEIDLKGMIRLIRPAAAAMKTADGGAIVCLSSIMGVAYGWDEHVHYSAAKSGVVGLVRGLGVELARDNIRVNGVAPGFIRTAQALSPVHSVGPKGLEKAAEYIPAGRVGEPEDIADVIHFLVSDAARYMTGQVVTVDGGLLVGRY
ncbi:MAG: SDR family NAD(P)-dependent oxidoreductase [Pseudomonadota bacterium]